MSSLSDLRHGSLSRDVWRFVLVGLIAGIVTASITAGLAIWGGVSEPAMSGTLGPYSLNNSTRYVELTFPTCSLVTVHWHVVTGSSANFSVWFPSEVVYAANCSGPPFPPTNNTCAVAVCGNVSMAPGPICWETGMLGSCSFASTQPSYVFDLYAGHHISNGTAIPNNLGNLIVSFTASYWFPTIT